MRRKANGARALFLLLGRDPNSESFRIFFHQPADDPLLEVNNDDHDKQSQGDELPPKEVSPGYFFDDMENDGADDRAPKCALAAEQHHEDHEDVEGRGGECDVARVDKSD